MPHKHKRKHAAVDDKSKGGGADFFDLPPEKRAKPLSVHKPKPETWEGFDDDAATKATSETKLNKRRKPNNRNKNGEEDGKGKVMDDTPKNFARLMAWQSEGRKLRKGLDDGEGRRGKEKSKDKKEKGKRKTRDIVDAMAESLSEPKTTKPMPSANVQDVETQAASVTATAPVDSKSDVQPPHATASSLKIKPGERLADFSLRVDQSLPLSNVPKHGTKDKTLGLKQKLTRHDRNLQRMQTEWRNAEGKIKARKEEEAEGMEDKREEDGLLWMDVESANANRKGKKNRKAGDLDDADPWKALEKKRKEAGGSGAGVVGRVESE